MKSSCFTFALPDLPVSLKNLITWHLAKWLHKILWLIQLWHHSCLIPFHSIWNVSPHEWNIWSGNSHEQGRMWHPNWAKLCTFVSKADGTGFPEQFWAANDMCFKYLSCDCQLHVASNLVLSLMRQSWVGLWDTLAKKKLHLCWPAYIIIIPRFITVTVIATFCFGEFQ